MSKEFSEFFSVFTEALKKPIYSDEEAKLEIGKNKSFSKTAEEEDIERDYISYDPFTTYQSRGFFDTAQNLTDRRALIGKWRRISWYPEVEEAISEIICEAIVYDEKEQPIKINLDELDVSEKIKKKMIESFEKIMFLLDFNKKGEDLFKQWYIDGQLNIEVVYDNNKITNGIQQLLILSPFDIWKVKDTKSGETYYVYSKNTEPSKFDKKQVEKYWLEDQLTHINSGLWSLDRKTPISFLNKAIKAINQLYLLEDAVVIWHITRSPEKRVFYIDTGNLPKSKAEEYIKRLITKYRQKKVYNIETGTLENRAKSISILEDFWLPRNAQGRGTQIETLQASASPMNEMTHVDYFVSKVYRALNIPITRQKRMGVESPRISINSGIDVEQDELRFFKYILKLRRRFNELFVDLLKKDLIAKKVFTLTEWNEIQEKILFQYSNNNPYSDIKFMQILQMRAEIAGSLRDLVEEKYISKKFIRSKILNQTEEEIEEIKKEIEQEEAEKPKEEPEFETENIKGDIIAEEIEEKIADKVIEKLLPIIEQKLSNN